jgi:response regulator NasT
MDLQEALTRLGHQVVATETGRQLVEICRASEPDLVVTAIRLPELDGIQAAAEVNRERAVPFILVSAYHDPQTVSRAAAEPVMAYLVKPVTEADLAAAIPVALSRFQDQQAAKTQLAHMQEDLEERKLIERAKGIMMKRLQVDEEDAFARLRKRSSLSNRRLAVVAREVIEADEVFVVLDRLGGRK